MLVIHTELVQALIAQARRDHPLETCGVIAGAQGSNEPLRLIAMRNIAQSTDFFEFEPKEQLQVWRDMDERDEEPLVIYHSHTDSPAFPSRDDVAHASEPNAHYIIIPTAEQYDAEIRSFRIVDGTITEERVQIVPAYKSGTKPLINDEIKSF